MLIGCVFSERILLNHTYTIYNASFIQRWGSNELHLLRYIYLEYIFWVINTFRVYLKWVLLLLLKYIFREKTVLLLRYCGRLSSRYFILMKYKLKILPFIPNEPSTFLWAMNDTHSRMIHSFESIMFKGTLHFFLEIGSFYTSPRVKKLRFTVFESIQPISGSGGSTFILA